MQVLRNELLHIHIDFKRICETFQEFFPKMTHSVAQNKNYTINTYALFLKSNNNGLQFLNY